MLEGWQGRGDGVAMLEGWRQGVGFCELLTLLFTRILEDEKRAMSAFCTEADNPTLRWVVYGSKSAKFPSVENIGLTCRFT